MNKSSAAGRHKEIRAPQAGRHGIEETDVTRGQGKVAVK